MELLDINYDNDEDLKLVFKVDRDFSCLYCKPIGKIKKGSNGNYSADYLFGKICQYYFQTNCYILILDFSELEYEFGNRLQKSVDFFNVIGRDSEEKENPIILIKPEKSNGLDSLLEWIKPKNITYMKNIEDSISLSQKIFEELLNE